MNRDLFIYDSLARDYVRFEPIHEDAVGMYVCGPTVYSDVHLGNCRTFVSFDIIYRYLIQLGYKVRYVRNITDVGHLEGDADEGEDKVSKKARLEKVEPMEVVQRYMNGFHNMMTIFNALPPNIEPRATGHIIEQIEMVKAILANGYAYERNGSVYFNTQKLVETHEVYGKLSGKIMDDLLNESRNLKNQDEKEHPSDFAIWIKADERHLMHWPSPWSEGFPGWHLECSAMSTKYLGTTFDIHGGGYDLKFPHHENEIAQNIGCCGHSPAKYWLHANMLLLNGRKMSKSDGNTISPQQLFTGESPHVTRGYAPMVIRFFMLQTHYRSTLDLTDEALQGAEKGFKRLIEATRHVKTLVTQGNSYDLATDTELLGVLDSLYKEMNDDFNSPKALAILFDLVTRINSFKDGHTDIQQISPATLIRLQQEISRWVFDILGLRDDEAAEGGTDKLDGVMQLLIDIRQQSRAKKDYSVSDLMRDRLGKLKIVLKDSKEGTTWGNE
ncbi:MAG: cysteine--tRNA ligase [Saprospiraceae bacterium]|nr:cysteine--tRNA ligase [Saprospiraceae bacterium]